MKTVKGDLLKLAEDGEFDIIIHGCNCFHVMKNGIAGQIFKKYPKVSEDDKYYTILGDKEKLGQHIKTNVEYKNPIENIKFIIISAYTQYTYNREAVVADYNAIEYFFKELNDLYKKCDPSHRIGIPRIGAGLAGGNWAIIKHIIELSAPNLDITLVEYTGD